MLSINKIISCAFIFLLTTAGYAQLCNNNPSIQAGDIDPAPLMVNQGGTLSFTYVENLLDYVEEDIDPVKLTICMLNLAPATGATPATAPASVGGSFSVIFNWIYDPVTNCFQGTQNKDIFGGTGGYITVGFVQTLEFLCPDNQMGFNANIQPANCMNGVNQTTDDRESVYTCLEPSLPIELEFFKGTEENCAVYLNWQTATEMGFSHFDIEKSLDGITFNQIGRVNGAGASGQAAIYDFVDEYPSELNYFRLKMNDLDGSISYSEIITIQANCANGGVSISEVFPNPVKDELINIRLVSTLDHVKSRLIITDIIGRQIMEVPTTIFEGTNLVSADPSRLPAAMYMVHLQGEGWQSKAIKFLKVND